MIDTDALIIGAGPVGLFQLFQLGLQGLRAEIIDVLPEPGGQCTALYPDKPIYDIPGVRVCTGRQLTQQLLIQAQPFMPADGTDGVARNLHLGQLVAQLQARPEGGFDVHTEQGRHFRCRVVFVAAGAGAFVPRSLNLPELAAASNVHYHLGQSDMTPWAGQHLVVNGGGDEALSTVLTLLQHPDCHQQPAHITLLHRRDVFQAEQALDAHVRELIAQGRVTLAVGMPSAAEVQNGRLSALQILGADSQTRALPLDHLLIRQGMSPKLGPLTQWGMALERKQVTVSTDSFESSTPGIYAVGDINTYPGKKRLLLCGFHEATLAAHHAGAQLNPDAPQHLLYTTTSPLLHQRLGVA